MDRSQRKAAVAAAKEDKVRAGIYAVRGRETGAVWVGRAPNLASVENRLTFALRTRSHACRSLQAAWDAAPGAFDVEILEAIAEDAHPSSWNRLLQEKLVQWADRLGAERL